MAGSSWFEAAPHPTRPLAGPPSPQGEGGSRGVAKQLLRNAEGVPPIRPGLRPAHLPLTGKESPDPWSLTKSNSKGTPKAFPATGTYSAHGLTLTPERHA